MKLKMSIINFLGLMATGFLVASCSVEVGPVKSPESSSGPRQISEPNYGMRLLDYQIGDPLHGGLTQKAVYPVSSSQRVLLEFDALESRSGRIRKGSDTPIAIQITVNGCGVGEARNVYLCPMKRRWGRMSTWNYFDTSYGFSGAWNSSGGDYFTSECMTPVFVSGFDGNRCTRNDRLIFVLNDWYRRKVNSVGSEFPDGHAILNQFVLIQAGSGWFGIIGDGGMGTDAPVLSWYE